MGRKLKDSRGETLVELLAAILIAALSVALLFTCCMASAEMGRNTREADKKYYEALSAAEEQKAVVLLPGEGSPTVTVTEGSQTDTILINVYGGEEMYSYKKEGS